MMEFDGFGVRQTVVLGYYNDGTSYYFDLYNDSPLSITSIDDETRYQYLKYLIEESLQYDPVVVDPYGRFSLVDKNYEYIKGVDKSLEYLRWLDLYYGKQVLMDYIDSGSDSLYSRACHPLFFIDLSPAFLSDRDTDILLRLISFSWHMRLGLICSYDRTSDIPFSMLRQRGYSVFLHDELIRVRRTGCKGDEAVLVLN